jgi:hypothetical protein
MKQSTPLVDVVLYLRGHDLDPQLVTFNLGVEGSKMRLKGEKWRTSTNHEVIAKIGLWTLSSNNKFFSLSENISWLKEKLQFAKCMPKNILGVEQVELSVFIALASDDEGDGNFESALTEQDIIWIRNIGAAMSFKLTHSLPHSITNQVCQ